MRPRSRPQEKIAHAVLLDIGWSVSPRIEDTAQDAIVLDLSGLTHLFGAEKDIGAHLVQRSCECGLLSNVAIASNVDTALIAARGFKGITVIPLGQESKSLGDLPVGVLFPSAETAETLSRWGVRTCAAFAGLPVLQLSERLGQEGVRLHALARGATSRSLAIAEPGHFFEEEMELDDAVEELDPLSFLLGRLLDQLCARLAARSLAAASLRVRFELQPAFENALDVRKEMFRRIDPPGVYERELRLPVPARDSKMLLKLLRLRLQSNPPACSHSQNRAGSGIRPAARHARRLVSSQLSGSRKTRAHHRAHRERGRRRECRLALAGRIHGARENFRCGGFSLRWNPRKRPAAIAARFIREGSATSGKSPASFRIFRPPVPATLELHAGCPTRVVFQGLRGEVLAASGPWRTSGDWWREDPWQQDEWDLEIHFHSSSAARDPAAAASRADCGLYRFYFDALRGSWFVRGIYD